MDLLNWDTNDKQMINRRAVAMVAEDLLGWLVNPPLWSRLEYLRCSMDCHGDLRHTLLVLEGWSLLILVWMLIFICCNHQVKVWHALLCTIEYLQSFSVLCILCTLLITHNKGSGDLELKVELVEQVQYTNFLVMCSMGRFNQKNLPILFFIWGYMLQKCILTSKILILFTFRTGT